MPFVALNAQLHDLLENWINAAELYLGAVKTQYPQDSYREWLIARELEMADSSLSSLPATQQLLAYAYTVREFWAIDQRDPDFLEGESPETSTRRNLARFAVEYMRASQGLKFDAGAFQALYEELEEFLFNYASIEFNGTVELWNVTLEASPFDLARGVTLREPTEAEREIGSDSLAAGLLPPPFGPKPISEVLIEITGTMQSLFNGGGPKSTWEYSIATYDVSKTADKVLLALRLLHSGSMGLGTLRLQWANRLMKGMWMDLARGPFATSMPRLDRGDPMTLANTDLDRVQTFWPFLNGRRKQRKKIDLAIRRFQTSFSRTSEEDRFVDQWIAIESLFSDRDTESTLRMSQALAQFIGSDAPDRYRTFSRSKAAYRARCAVVHGRHAKDEDAIGNHMEFVDNVLRRALLKCMETKSAPDLGRLARDLFLHGP